MTQALVLAQNNPSPEQGSPQQGSPLSSMLPLMLIMFAIIYFLLIRPQSKERKRHQAMIDNLKKNDQVVTQSGIYGTVAAIEKEAGTVSLKIADNVRIKITRASIARTLESETNE